MNALPTGLAPVVLALELFAIFVIPLLIFHGSRMFSRELSFQLAAGVALIFYLALPDPIDIGVVDDLFVAVLLVLLAVPVVRDRVLDVFSRGRPTVTPPIPASEITIEPRSESDANA